MKYLLSSGFSTDRIELYILDLFRIHLQIYPGDIPGMSGYGFDFIISDVMKSSLYDEIRSRASSLVEKIKSRFGGGIDINLVSVTLVDEKSVNIVLDVNGYQSEEVINLYE